MQDWHFAVIFPVVALFVCLTYFSKLGSLSDSIRRCKWSLELDLRGANGHPARPDNRHGEAQHDLAARPGPSDRVWCQGRDCRGTWVRSCYHHCVTTSLSSRHAGSHSSWCCGLTLYVPRCTWRVWKIVSVRGKVWTPCTVVLALQTVIDVVMVTSEIDDEYGHVDVIFQALGLLLTVQMS